MVEVKIPFISGENRELAELGRDTLSGSDWFWVQFFLIGFGAGAFPLALDYYFGYRPLGIQGMYWFAGAWFLAGMWAGANKFWDDQKRGSPRWSSPGFEGTVRTNRGTVYIPAVTEKSVMVYPSLRAVPEGVDNLVHWTPTRGVKIIERDDGVFAANGKHFESNTVSRVKLWDELPQHVQSYLRTNRRLLKIRFVRGDWRDGRPVLGTKFVYGDKPMFKTFHDYPFEIDTSSEIQADFESRARSAAERMGAYAVGTAETASKLHSQLVVKRAKTSLPELREQETEEQEEGF